MCHGHFHARNGSKSRTLTQNLLWAWRASISEQKNRKSFVSNWFLDPVSNILTDHKNWKASSTMFFLLPSSLLILWSRLLMSNFKGFGILSEFFKKITAICISVEIPIEEVDEPILTTKTEKLHLFFLPSGLLILWSRLLMSKGIWMRDASQR